ncbi:MAG: DUF2764 family protein [Spirochaetota bacterium]
MSQYYYTVSSLPMLLFESESTIGIERFIETCKETLTGRDFELLNRTQFTISEHIVAKNEVLNNWYAWETALRNELVKLRAQKIGVEAAAYHVPGPDVLGAAEIAREAFNQESPLLGENVLNRARWKVLDDLEVGHYFDIEKLIVYYLRLQLLQRKSNFRKEIGETKYTKIYEGISRTIQDKIR